MTQNIEHLLDAYLISVSLLWSRVCQGILLIFNQVVLLLLNFKSALYILWITAIYKHFFFQFVSCLFILLTVFYRVETVSLSRVQFINYLFHRSHFGLIPKKTLPYARSSRFSHFFSGSFILLPFTCRSVIHFSFIFVSRCQVYI